MRKLPIFVGLVLAISVLRAQTASIQDCIGAIPVCQKIYVESQSPVGRGNFDEVNPDFNCMQVESNSIWYTFTVNTSGNFGFLLTPMNLGDDYDWALFNLTDASCSDLYTDPSLIVSCNAAGGGTCNGQTGADGKSNFSIQGAGCGANSPNFEFGRTPYNALIPVKAQNTYALVVSNWTGSKNGYTIDFGVSSDIGIFDEEAPYGENAGLEQECDGGSLELQFSEFVQCTSVQGNDFELNGPGGPYTIAVESPDCSAGGNFSKTFFLSVMPPLRDTGTYELRILSNRGSEILDLCGNAALEQSLSIAIDALDVPADLGDDVTFLCEGEILNLSVGAIGAQVLWNDNSTDPNRSFNVAGTYAVQISTACGTDTDTVSMSYVSTAPTANLGPDLEACPGEEILLSAFGEAATYRWQDNNKESALLVRESGNYGVTITNACGEASDEVTIFYQPALQLDLGRDTFLCDTERIRIAVESTAKAYRWQDGSTLPDYAVEGPGIYILQAFNDCESIADTLVVRPCQVCEIQAPNVFSPNADGNNDHLAFFSNCTVLSFQLKVFSRWGELLFESSDPTLTWDGRHRGEDSPSGTYVWFVSWEGLENGQPKSFAQSGSVALIR